MPPFWSTIAHAAKREPNPLSGQISLIAHRQRIAGVGLCDVIHAEVATEHGPCFGRIGGIGGRSPVKLERNEIIENRPLRRQADSGAGEGLIEIIGFVGLYAVRQALHFLAIRHAPTACDGAVAQAALTAGQRVDGSDRVTHE